MLTSTQSQSVQGTQNYFEEVLSQGDYYMGQEVGGQWHGNGTALLGLKAGSAVTKEQFTNLLEGKCPVSGKNLLQRVRKDRRPGMDLTFSVPKSVSLAWAICEDEKILKVLQESVRQTMEKDVQPLMQRRVRGGKFAMTREKKKTGKMVYADFLHKTSRPVGGKADPHLHVHAFVINWTHDGGKHYAAEMQEIVRQRLSLQAKFEARLARKLSRELGYAVEHVRFRQSGRMKSGWEIKGLDRKTIEKFSQRTAQIEKVAQEKQITDPSEKAQLGKKTREGKDTGKSLDELRTQWNSRLSRKEQFDFARLRGTSSGSKGENEQLGAQAAIHYALDHHLERQSVVEHHQVVGTALEKGLTLPPELVEQTLRKMDLVRRTTKSEGTDRHLLTTKVILEAEQRMIHFARDGRGTERAIAREEHVFERTWLSEGQKEAVSHVLNSRDKVIAISGGAGTGKTSLMQEATEGIGNNGIRVLTFAPSSGATEVLEKSGFRNTKTVEHLLRNEKLQSQLGGQVLWVDEAGLLDVRAMNGLFKVAAERNCRLVLVGDTGQHASPGRGEALRLLEKEAGMKIARVTGIQRQKGLYRYVVDLISRGQKVAEQHTGKSGLVAGFDLLDQLGKIKEIPTEDRHEALAKTYLQWSGGEKNSPLVIAPTHAEAKLATECIRSQLRREGKLPEAERPFLQLSSVGLSKAEKSNPLAYLGLEKSVVQFHQNAKGGFQKGDRFEVKSIEEGRVIAECLSSGKERLLPLEASGRFEVYSASQLGVAAGDKIRFSLGGKTAEGKTKISNGRLDTVSGFDRQGNIILSGGNVIDKNYGHLDLGYVITSHASQGKDRNRAIAAMGSASGPAINARQFYVTVSRGKEDVVIYVDDKEKVRRQIERSGEQMTATELSQFEVPETRHLEEMRDRHSPWGGRLAQSFRDRVSRWLGGGDRKEGKHSLGRHRDGEANEFGGRTMGLGQSFGMSSGLG